ncbi:Protein GrpE [candidate division SR1 bacterium Aalborg_AAW-1]|nr:Protein GrpE [candidate division SR1 bacterium Aalborg_AAW-1]
MTQITDENTTTPITEDTDLQNILDQAQETQDTKSQELSLEELQAKIKELESKLADAEAITKKAQSDYIHMKFDFDSYMRRNEESAKTAKVDTLVDVVKKFTPFIDGLRQSLANIPDEQRDDVLVQGVQMVYNKFISSLEMMGIQKIESLGQTPDIELHEAVSALPVTDETQKGKIIQEFEQGFIYDKGDIKKVVTPAKVVIGQ